MNRKHKNQMSRDYSTFYKKELNKNINNFHHVQEPLTADYKVKGFNMGEEEHKKSESKWC